MNARWAIAAAAVLVVVALLVPGAAVYWRAAEAPVSIGPLKNIAARALNDTIPGARLETTRGIATWRRGEDEDVLSFSDVAIYGGPFDRPLAVKHAEVTLDGRALRRGKVAVEHVALTGISGALDWRLAPLLQAEEPRRFDYERLRAAGLTALSNILAQRKLGQGFSLAVRDVRIALREVESGVRHVFAVSEAKLGRDDDDLQAALTGSFARDDLSAPFTLEAAFGDSTGRIAAGLDLPPPSELLGGLPLEGWDRAVDAEIEMRANVTIRPEAHEDEAELRLVAGAGRFAHETLYSEPVKIDRAVIEASARPALAQIEIENLALAFAETAIVGRGQAALIDAKPVGGFEAAFEPMSIATLKRYWPESVGVGGRAWVIRNIESGRIYDAKLALRIDAEDWALERLPQEALTIDFAVDGLTAHYRSPMPPIETSSGKGHLTLENLLLEVEGGMIAGMEIGPSRVLLASFPTRPQWADIELAARGPASGLLAVLDSEPLGYISDYGIDKGAISGAADVSLTLRFPLLKDLLFEQVAFSGTVVSEQLAAPALFGDVGFRDGNFVFTVSEDALSAKGNADIVGADIAIEWHEDFSGATELPTQLSAHGRLSVAQLAALGLELPDALTGAVAVSAQARGRAQTIAGGDLSLDLTDIGFVSADWPIEKPPGKPAHLQAKFSSEEGALKIQDAELNTAGLDAGFGLKLNGDGDFEQLTLDRLSFKRNELSGSIGRQGDRWIFDLSGPQLDLSPEIAKLYAPDAEEGPDWLLAELPDVFARLAFSRVILANDKLLTDVTADIVTQDDRWQTALLSGTFASGKSLEIGLESDGDARRLKIRADDAGETAKALDLYDRAEGGVLALDAEMTGSGATTELTGSARVTDFRIVEAPGFARLLSVGSLTGIADLLEDGGIEFREIDLPFSLTNGVIDIAEASAVGPALGITLDGQFIHNLKQADLKGVLVPAYGVNSFLGNIPVLGFLLTGGDKQGVFGVSYRLAGDLAAPDITVNPVSIFAPGILRTIISGPRGSVDAPFETSAPDGAEADAAANP